MKVGYLGPEGSFSYGVAAANFRQKDLQAFHTIFDCLEAVESGQLTKAVVPIENSYEGTVHDTLDFLYHQGSLYVEKEMVMPIHHCLAVHPEMAAQSTHLTGIYSHPQALSQTKRYLHEHHKKIPQTVVESTAKSAQYVALHGQKEAVAAICSEQAAELFGLSIIAREIEDSPDNQTRFWVVSKKKNLTSQKDLKKMSVCLTLTSDHPGTLHQSLAAFSWRNINLSKIESRPLKTQLGFYFFLLDIVIDCPISLIELAFEEIHLLNGRIKELGAYPIKIIK
ncbi:prephenate dehydratase [Vagococcus elongatus]|uniref:Prephenate dehydratase n=1 Tax=Vagococcus elongatus TaxID=180344 RepID=A0A430ASH1_9ENTE|nr:prephenate dehydratase [Vagococcus elongatus]RSU11004.1 hypothetical protein CBF29_08560 [Vagococcus elongatus]